MGKEDVSTRQSGHGKAHLTMFPFCPHPAPSTPLPAVPGSSVS